MAKPQLRAAYDDHDKNSAANGLDCRFHADGSECPSRTQQQFAKDADINTIVKRFGITGELPVNNRVPLSGDFSNAGTYEEALQMLRAADESFMAMPADVRERFGNNPAKFVAFCDDMKTNHEEMIKLGLAIKKEQPKKNDPLRVVIVDPATGEVRKEATIAPKSENG